MSYDNGDGTYQPPVELARLEAATTIADINSDGYQDLAFRGLSLSVFLGQADGTFVQYGRYLNRSDGADAVVANFDGDGLADIARASSGRQRSVEISFQRCTE